MARGSIPRIEVRVKPRARADRVGGAWGEGMLVVEVQAPAVDGKANTAVVAALADAFDIHRRQVEIVAGLRSRSKVVAIDDDPERVAARRAQLLAGP